MDRVALAAQRINTVRESGWLVAYPEPGQHAGLEFESDAFALAKHYQASRPDSDEPITAEWLASCGWTDTGTEYTTPGMASPWSPELVRASEDDYRRRLVLLQGFLRLEEQLIENDEPVLDWETGLPQESCTVLPQTSSRAYLKQLCDLLGIPLTVSKADR